MSLNVFLNSFTFFKWIFLTLIDGHNELCLNVSAFSF